jgi:hypothetical protein
MCSTMHLYRENSLLWYISMMWLKLMHETSCYYIAGIKLQHFYGVLPFWGLLERMESSYPPLPEFKESVSFVLGLSNIRNPLGLARAWIRHCMNLGNLDTCIATIVKQSQVRFFYVESAVLMDEDSSYMLVRLLPCY